MEESGPANTTPEDILTPNDSLEQPTQVQVTPVTTSAAPGVVTAPMAGSNGSATVTPPTPPTQPTEPVNEPRTGIFKNKLFQKIGITSAVMLLIIGLLVLSTFLYQKSRKQTLTQEQKVAQIKDQTVTLGNSSSPAAGQPSLRVGVSTLFVNGDISTQGLLRFSSGATYGQISINALTSNQTYALPNSSGTICLDSDNCGYATTAQLTSSVATLQAATTSGLGLPQDLSATATPTFAGIKLSGTGTQNGFTLCDSSNNCNFGTSSNALLQGGNTFGTTVSVGAKDNNGINFLANNTTVASLSNTGQALFKNSANSTTAFQIQNASGASLLNVNSTSNLISLLGNNSGEPGAWSTSSNGLPAARENATSVIANGYVYNIGGYDGSSYKNTVYYAKLNTDGSTGSWNTNANALPANRNFAASVVANGYVYVIGGSDGSTVQSTVYYAKLNADGSVGSWSTTTSLPAARYFISSAVVNGYVYVTGGVSSLNVPQSTVYYAKLNSNGTLAAWTTSANTLPAARYTHTMLVNNGYVYALGGVSSSGAVQSTVYYAKLNTDGSTGSWSTAVNALPAVRGVAASVTANGYLYVIGGGATVDGSTPQTTVYYASTARLQVGANLDLVGLQGATLADGGDAAIGSSGGALTAGNGTFVGSLQVQGQAAFDRGLTIAGNISANSYAQFQSSVNATNAFQIQNSSGTTLFNADTVNNKINVVNIANTTLGTWTQSPNNIPAQRGLAGSAVANGYMYYVGGSLGSAQTGVYYTKLNSDGSTGVWSTAANSLPSARYSLMTFIFNGYIYAIGGNDATNTTQATAYYAKLNADGSVGAWSTTTALPSARSAAAVGVANGYAYIVGGTNAITAQQTVYYAAINSDGTLGAWTTSGNSLPAARYSAVSFVYNGYMYVLGGFNSVAQSNAYFAPLNSDGTVGVWATTTSLPAARSNAIGAAYNGTAYFMGGYDGANAVSTIYSATINGDGTLSAWTTATNSLPVARWQAASIVSNGYMYMMGGYDGVSLYNTVYYTQLPGGSTGLNVSATTSTFNSSLTIQNSDGSSLLNANTVNNTLTVGTTTTDTPTLLVLGIKSTSGDPTGTSGAIYYNSSLGKFRCYQAGAWTNCIGTGGAGGGDVNNGGNTFAAPMTIGTLDNNSLSFLTNTHTVQTLSSSGQATFKNFTDSTSAFTIQNSTNGVLFQADTTNSRVGINLGVGSNLLTNQGLDVVGALRLDGSTAATLDTFTTPVGSSTNTKINIPLYDPGALSQVVAYGLPSTANISSWALSLFDGRAVAHQPTIAVFSPDETKVVGFNWNGSNATAQVQTGDSATLSTGGLTVGSGAVTGGAGLASGAVILQSGNGSGTNTSSGNVTIDSGAATGAGTTGTIGIGTTNTSGITIGRVGITTAVNGTLQGSVINATTGFQISGTATNGQYLRGNGTDFVASALQASDMTGTLAINNGGTNNTSAGYSTNGIFYYDGTKFVSTAAGVAGQCLTATAGAPAWAACGAGGGGSISQGGNAYGTTIAIGATDANGVNILASNTAVATFSATGQALFQNTANSALAFKIQNATGSSLFTVDSSNARIYIGNPVADGTGVLLVLDTKNTAGDPTGVDGAMYYNSSLGKFRCYENGAWTNCIYNIQTATKTADQTFSATSYADVNDLSFSVLANKVYKLQCSLVISVPAGTNGGNLSTNGPASPTQLTATFAKSIDQSSGDNYATSSSYDDGSAATTFKVNTVSTGSNRFIVSYNALLVNGANNGTWILRSKAYDGSSSITIYANSSCNIQPL